MDDVEEMTTNPEAPPGDEQVGDDAVGAVAGTLYTKAWVLDMLVQLVKAMEGDKQLAEEYPDEDELDNVLVKLWDVSTEAPVACFLAQNQVIDILLPACLNADPSSKSRMVEISLGVLANTVSISETGLADEIASNDFYRQGVVGLFSRFTTDADALIQACRLLNACLHCHPSNIPAWEDFLLDLNLANDEEDASEFSLPDWFIFVLKSSKNEQLLLDVTKLLEMLCGNVGRFLHQYAASPQFVVSVVEAMRELNWSAHSEPVCRLINVLYMVSTVEHFRNDFSTLITTQQDDVVSKLAAIAVKLLAEETTDLEVDDISCSFASTLSLFLTILTLVSPGNFPLLFQQSEVWAVVRKVYKLLAKYRFSPDDEQSPAAVLKLNVIEFVESIRSTQDVNVEQYILNKILV